MDTAAFLAKEIADCQARGIDVKFHPTSTIMLGGLETSGWFDEETLQVAIDRPLQDWLPVFVHESCHKDQFVEKVPVWNTKIGKQDACELLDMWLEDEIEMTPKRLAACIEKNQAVELDCEKRSIEKIKAYGLPIDIELYTKKANGYVWFYRTLPITRTWLVAPYNNPKLLALMPTHFDNDYSELPSGFLEIIQEFIEARK